MDRFMQLRHLAEAEEHVVRGAQHVSDQETRVMDLDHRGQDSLLARAVLENFRALQAQHEAHRDHILTALGR